MPADRAKGMNKSSSEKTNKSEETGPLKTYEQIDADIIKNLDIDAAVKNMKKFRKMIRKIKHIMERMTNKAIMMRMRITIRLKKKSQILRMIQKQREKKRQTIRRKVPSLLQKLIIMDFAASTALREEIIARTVTLEMITIRKLRQIPRKIFFVMILEIEEIIENQLLREM